MTVVTVTVRQLLTADTTGVPLPAAHRRVRQQRGPELRARLPEVAEAELGGLRFAVVHETGPAKARERRCAERFPGHDVLVFGHSHIPWDSTTEDGRLRLLNPGSPTDRRRQPYCTYMTAEVDGGELSGVRLHRLPLRR